MVDPETMLNMNGQTEEFYEKYLSMLPILGRFDNSIITGASSQAKLIIMMGRYAFDKNPFIGTMADINVWSR